MLCPKCGQSFPTKKQTADNTCPFCDFNFEKYILPGLKIKTHDQAIEKKVITKINPKINKDAKNYEGCLQILATIIFMIFFIRFKMENPEPPNTPNKPNEFTSVQALTLCQHVLTRLSRDPETANVPYVDNLGGHVGDEYYFAWGADTRYARMRNGLGLEVPVSASCIVSRTTKKIIQLTFDGKSIL